LPNSRCLRNDASGIRGPQRTQGALDRLQRLYVRHFRRELVRQNQYIEAAAKTALVGAATSIVPRL
jgi:hypothetical protein